MPQDDLALFIQARQKKLETNKSNFNDRMQDIADYVAPHRDDIYDNLVRGEVKGKKIFDGTAVSAAVLATDGIHGYHVSPAFAWFKYSMNRKNINKINEIREWLDEIEFNMYMALNRSNFYDEMWMYIYDGFTMGTSNITMDEDLADGTIAFETVHPGEIFVAENKYGQIDIVHRKRKMEARKIVQRFGLENVTPKIQEVYKTQPFSEFEVLHAVYPREDYDTRKKDAKNKRYASTWIICDGNKIARDSGYDRFPQHVWRYMKTGKEAFGVSPAMLAMSDIKGINIMGKSLLGAAQLATDPPLNVPAHLRGSVQWKPRGLNYYKNAGEVVTPVNIGSNYPVGVDREERKQAMIKERFHIDTFLLLTQLAGQGDRTAFEVSEMMAEKAAVLGAELGPFNKQIEGILEHVYQIETDAGRMPEPPDILLEMADKDDTIRFDPVFQGPLAQSQRDKFGKEPIRKFFMDIAPLVEIDQDVIDNIDTDATLKILGEFNDIPMEMLRKPEAVEAIREGKAQAEAEAAMQEQMAAAVQGLKTASEADKNMGGRLTSGMPNVGEQLAAPV